MNYTDALLPYLLGSQPLPQTPWPPQQPQLPSGVTFGMMAAPIDNARSEAHHRPLVWHAPDTVNSMGAGLGIQNLDVRYADMLNARAQQQTPMARALGINDITRLTPQSFATTDDGNVYFNYGR